MILKACLKYPYHIVKENGEENCWSAFSKCIVNKALERFLNEEKVKFRERLESEIRICMKKLLKHSLMQIKREL